MIRRVMVDTNLILSAFLWGGVPRQLLTLMAARGFVVLRSDETYTELERKLRSGKFDKQMIARQIDVEGFLQNYTEISELVIPAPVPLDVIQDPKDLIIVACAVGGKAM